MDTVCFVILHYGSYDETDQCVRSILELGGSENARIVIVDNETERNLKERESLVHMYEWDSRIHVLTNTEDGGFSHGNNLGYAYARDVLKADCIVMTNNDVVFQQREFLLVLFQSAYYGSCHIVGPKVIHGKTGKMQSPISRGLRTIDQAERTIKWNRIALRFFPAAFIFVKTKEWIKGGQQSNGSGDYDWDYETAQTDVIPCGACLIFTPPFVYNEAKAFDPETQFYYEEYLLALRCQRKGYRMAYEPALSVLHESGASTGRKFGTDAKRMRFHMTHIKKSCEIYIRELRKEMGTGDTGKNGGYHG